ncbi:MAG: DUF2344 domain-containing protein [Lachnospiraceae bacterium]|nr:DUF2344 domain-containing protein [Lachnospiraceae bacterium]
MTNEHTKVRIKFSKYGSMIFIGHLDIMRYFQKAMRRADIDIAYTTGFNPHQIMSFAAPLGVGLYSNGEYLDIEMNEPMNSKLMITRLNSVMVEGIDILSVKKLPKTAGNAMASVAAAAYTVAFREGYEPDFDYKEKLSDFASKDRIMVTKKTKKSEKEMDLKPFIYELSIVNDKIHMLVDASSSGNIKPSLVMEAFYKENGEVPSEFAFIITREDTYTNIGTDEKSEFVPLDAVGSEM